jgi:hypothetical protein
LSGQELFVTEGHFDPALPPTLTSILGSRSATTPCGDGRLQAGDTVTFVMSEPLSVASAGVVRQLIVDAINASGDDGTNLVLANVAVAGNVTFTATLPAGAALETANPLLFDLSASGVADANNVPAVILQAPMAPADVLGVNLSVARNIVQNDGRLVGGDQLALVFSCQMDEVVTLSAVQRAVDSLMGDGVGRTLTVNFTTFSVEILPGRMFELPGQAQLSIDSVATDVDVSGEADDGANDGRVTVEGPFQLPFDDLAIEDVTLTYVDNSADGFQASFRAVAPLTSGTWYLAAISANLARNALELPVVFTDQP